MHQILSGDTIIVRGVPKGGPPPERTIGLSGVTAPKLARRPAAPNSELADNKDFRDEVSDYAESTKKSNSKFKFFSMYKDCNFNFWNTHSPMHGRQGNI